MDPSIGGGHALTVAGGAATDGKCVVLVPRAFLVGLLYV